MSRQNWETVEGLTASYTGHKGHLTRAEKRVNELLGRLTALQVEPTGLDLKQLETCISHLSKKVNDLELIGDEFLSNFPEQYPKDLEAKVNAALRAVDKALDYLREKQAGGTTQHGDDNEVEGDRRTKESRVDYSIRHKELLGDESNFREFQA